MRVWWEDQSRYKIQIGWNTGSFFVHMFFRKKKKKRHMFYRPLTGPVISWSIIGQGRKRTGSLRNGHVKIRRKPNALEHLDFSGSKLLLHLVRQQWYTPRVLLPPAPPHEVRWERIMITSLGGVTRHNKQWRSSFASLLRNKRRL